MSYPVTDRTIASCLEHASTNIPLPTTKDRYRARYEQAEQERKALLVSNEKSLREYNELDRKYQQLKLENMVVSVELSEKTDQLKQLSKVSQDMCKEYDILKNQYELETQALHRAFTGTERCFNKKKDSSVTDATDGEEDFDALRLTVTELSAENARIQTELSEAKLNEFEANEQLVNLTQEIEALQKRCDSLETELRNVKEINDHLTTVSKLVSNELDEVRDAEKKHRENAVTLRREADDAKKERNVLAHQSQLLLQGVSLDVENLGFLQEIEQLKRLLEENTNNYKQQISELQEKIEDMEHDSDRRCEIVEERLKLAESDLQMARERIEQLEKENEQMPKQSVNPPAPPPPPPIPVPPPPPPPFLANTVTSTTEKIIRRPSVPTIPKIENPSTNIEDVVSQIKGRKFCLRSTNLPQKDKKKNEQPEAVSEMLSILGRLRKSPVKRSSVIHNNHLTK